MSKADGPNQMRPDGMSMEPREASGRRKRAFHRALKRRCFWAIYDKTIFDSCNLIYHDLVRRIYTPDGFNEVEMYGLNKFLPEIKDDPKT